MVTDESFLIAFDGLPYYSSFIIHLVMYLFIHLFIFSRHLAVTSLSRASWTKLRYEFLNVNRKQILLAYLKLPTDLTISHCLNELAGSAACSMQNSSIYPLCTLWLQNLSKFLPTLVSAFSLSLMLAFGIFY